MIRAQMEGGIGFALGAAMYGEITLGPDGRPQQGNFDKYRSLRMSEMPEVEVSIIKSGADPTGVGEPGVPPLAPARESGHRVDDLYPADHRRLLDRMADEHRAHDPSLLSSGTLRRFPRIRFIFAHAGGVMQLLVQRIARFKNWPQVGERGFATYFPGGAGAQFAALYFECAQAYSPPNMDAIRTLGPDSQLLFGSDYPVFSLGHATDDFARLKLPRSAVAAIARRNAATLLPRWS